MQHISIIVKENLCAFHGVAPRETGPRLPPWPRCRGDTRPDTCPCMRYIRPVSRRHEAGFVDVGKGEGSVSKGRCRVRHMSQVL